MLDLPQSSASHQHVREANGFTMDTELFMMFEMQIMGLHFYSFIVSSSTVGTINLHIKQVPQELF